MNRERMKDLLFSATWPWDLLVIGGGATGLGTAVDAASRGLRVALLEQDDFAKGTSSRSTKLIHGGVRYLAQGNVGLVRQSLHERGLLRRNAPHLVRTQPFVVPAYSRTSRLYYGTGLRLYDRLSGKLGLGPSRKLSREETLTELPTLAPEHLRGGVHYYDGQFDDARLAINLAQTVADLGGVAINYFGVVALLKAGGRVVGVIARDRETRAEHEIHARMVVNATGVFVDQIRRMDEPGTESAIVPSQGAHLVLDRSFLPGPSALMIPRTEDGRVLFAIPWHGRIIVGTTDTPIDQVDLEPRPLEEEVDFLLRHAARYLVKPPERQDVLSAFAGLRPLVKPAGGERDTAAISRDHVVMVSPSGLVTVTGGKWTTYRRMAQDAVDTALRTAGLDGRPCPTETLHIHGWHEPAEPEGPWAAYGWDGPDLQALVKHEPRLGGPIHPRLPYPLATVVWAARQEMARTLEDVLSRRTRCLLLDARASAEAAPAVAALMARELSRDAQWEQEQVAEYRVLAQRYLLA